MFRPESTGIHESVGGLALSVEPHLNGSPWPALSAALASDRQYSGPDRLAIEAMAEALASFDYQRLKTIVGSYAASPHAFLRRASFLVRHMRSPHFAIAISPVYRAEPAGLDEAWLTIHLKQAGRMVAISTLPRTPARIYSPDGDLDFVAMVPRAECPHELFARAATIALAC